MKISRWRGIGLGAVLLLQACHKKAPHLEISQPNHDFGRLYAGDSAEHLYEFRNSGDADLQVLGVNASCGCTATELWVETAQGPRRGEVKTSGDVLTVHPGESGKLRIVLNTQSAGAAGGEKSGSVTFTLNEPDRAYARFQFVARIEKPYKLEKEQFEFGSIGRREKVQLSTALQIPSDSGARFNISKITSTHPALQGHVLAEGTPGAFSYRLEITAGPELPLGNFNGKVTFQTDLPKGHDIVIAVYGLVLPDIAAQPPVLNFQFLSKGIEGQSSVEIRCTDPERKIRLGKTTVEGGEAEKLSPQIQELETGKRFLLTLKSSAQLGSPSFRGIVRIETDHPEMKLVEIPYRGFVR